MSVELEWQKLDCSLSRRLVELVNKHLATVERPSFIGPVEVVSIDFGTVCPDVEIVDMRDIYRDFLEDDEDEEDPIKVTEGSEDDEGYEWVSRRATGKAMAHDEPTYHHLPPHLRYGKGPSPDFFSHSPGLLSQRDIWNGGMSLPNLMDAQPPYSYRPGLGVSMYGRPTGVPLTPTSTPYTPNFDLKRSSSSQNSIDEPPPPTKPEVPNNHPDLQLHFRILHHSDVRLTITTSLLINYPSPMFMSLPIKLSVVGLVFNGEVVVAYEGSRRRVHFCIVDDIDPYGPVGGDRPKRDSASSTPPDLDGDSSRQSKPLPLGQRLLPSIYIESEIGQADKHVLKNVTRVERFIQDVIRKTVEDELVFPNFHTLILGEQ